MGLNGCVYVTPPVQVESGKGRLLGPADLAVWVMAQTLPATPSAAAASPALDVHFSGSQI